MTAPGSSRRTSWTAAALLATTFPPPKWAVPGVLAEGLNLLVGAPKLGKSWWALDVGIAIASGGVALGKVQVERGDVIYLSLEDVPRRLQQRLRMVLDGEPVPDGLHFETEWPALADGGAKQLHERLRDTPNCRLLIVDVLARVRGQGDGNANRYDAYYAAMETLKQLADQHGVSVLVIHHTRKAASEDYVSTVSGTNGLAGAADAILVMARSRNSADAVLQITGRDVQEAELAMQFQPERGAWTLLEGPAADWEMSPERRRVLSLVREAGGMRPKQVAEHLGIEYEAAKKTLQRMANDGQVDNSDGFYCVPPETLSPCPCCPPRTSTGTAGTEGTPLLGYAASSSSATHPT